MIDPVLVDRLFRRANAARWSLAPAQFGAALARSAVHAHGGTAPAGAALDRYLSGLHLEDLALACACLAGIDAAWEHFVRDWRPALYRAATAVDSSGGARDLADSIYGDLFGVSEQGRERQSLFLYFHGRSSLATWLRAVLAQRQVDRHRAGRRTDPLPEDESPKALAAPTPDRDPDRARFVRVITGALAHAVASLLPRERLRLACYYAQDLTLAQTGKLLAEHEATTSRQLAKTRAAIREQLERQLRSVHGLTDEEIARCFETVAEDAGPMDLGNIFKGGDGARSGPPDVLP